MALVINNKKKLFALGVYCFIHLTGPIQGQETPEMTETRKRRYWRRSGVFINFEQISHINNW